MIGKLKNWEDLYRNERCTFDRDQYMVWHDTTGMYLPVWVGHIHNFGKELDIMPYSVDMDRTIYQEVGNPVFKMYDCWFEYINTNPFPFDYENTNPFPDYEFFSDDDLRIVI